MTDIIKLAVVGAGLVGQRHIDAISKQAGVTLIAIVEPNLCDELNTLDVPNFDDLASMLDAVKPDGVILSTPTPLHVSQGLECIAQGCPVMVEKPLATSASEAKILTDAAQAAGVSLLVGHHRRHNPLIQKAHDLISQGVPSGISALSKRLVGSINQTRISR